MLDHIVLATPDVQASVAEIEAAIGLRPELGGHFPGRGVYNHLLALQGDAYLEIIGPDPAQPNPEGALPFGMDDFGERGAHVPHWCCKAGAQIEERVAWAKAAGYDIGEVRPLGRQLPDGTRLDWRLTRTVWPPLLGGLVPFLIDWGDARHPSTTAVKGARLVSWHGEHPDLAAVRRAHDALGVELELREGTQPALVAVIEGPGGSITLR
ncbi:MAG: VOC family protein [Chloroflexi bacterium]|nr:VOC family protein [Chloroflexota bacterium]MCY3696142.1 VOC family protein [Chloroflexota bacterium]